MLQMIEPGFEFSILREDLLITSPPSDGVENTVFNRRFNLLHHHDFRRNQKRQVDVINEDELEKLNSKYRHLFTRLFEDVRSASRPLFVLNGLTRRLAVELDNQALHPHGPFKITFPELVDTVCQHFGSKSSVLVIAEGSEEEMEEYGNGVRIRLPDDGSRIPKGGYAEPVNIFRRGFSKLGLPQALSPSVVDQGPVGAPDQTVWIESASIR